MRPCKCSKSECRLCWLYANDPDYKAYWDSNDAMRVVGRSQACIHRGEAIGMARCEACKSIVHLKVFACAVHAQCTLSNPIPAISCCKGCLDREPLPTNG